MWIRFDAMPPQSYKSWENLIFMRPKRAFRYLNKHNLHHTIFTTKSFLSFIPCRAKLNGINLNIRIGDDKFYGDMLDRFNELYAEDRGRTYLITASPKCGLPLTDFKTSIDEKFAYFDAIYIRHDYATDCHPSGIDFEKNLEKWVKKIKYFNAKSFKGTKFYLVLVLSLELKYYMTFWKDFKPLYEKVSTLPIFFYQYRGGFRVSSCYLQFTKCFLSIKG